MTAEGCSECGALEPELPDRADRCVDGATVDNRAEKHGFVHSTLAPTKRAMLIDRLRLCGSGVEPAAGRASLRPMLARALFFFASAAVAGAAASFPKPDPERRFPELKVYSGLGDSWRSAKEDWEGARRRTREDPVWADWLRREREEVGRWMTRHRDRVDWLPGWSHDGVSPKDGSRVPWTEAIPHEEAEFFASPSDPRIEITPKLHAWWVVGFRARHVETMVRAAQLFRLTGDASCRDWAAEQMDFYAANFLRWEPQRPGHPARLFWQTLTEATNLVKFVEVVRLLGDAVAPDRRDVWRREFFEPEVKALNSTQQQVHNIALWQRCAVAQVALLLGDEALWKGAIDGPWGVRRQISEGVTSDYFWFEQSLGYNAFVAQAMHSLGLAAGLAGRADDVSHELAVAQNLLLAPLTLRFPDGRLPNPADSRGGLRAPDADLLARSYRVFPTTLGLEEARRLRDWNTLLDPPPAPPRPVVLPEVAAVHLESTRMAVLRSGAWQVFLHYGQLAKSHSQREALNYSATYGDVDITHDPGTVGYGSPLHRGYYTRGLAHNVPLIDGEAQEGHDRGQVLEFSPARVRAAQPNYQPGVSVGRELAIEGGALRDTVTVECAGGPRRLGLSFHLQGRTRLPDGFWADTDFARGRPEEFAQWTEVRAGRFKENIEFEAAFGGSVVMRVVVSAPGEFRIWRGFSPDAPPRRRESFYLELTEPASRAVFTTTLAPVSAQ